MNLHFTGVIEKSSGSNDNERHSINITTEIIYQKGLEVSGVGSGKFTGKLMSPPLPHSLIKMLLKKRALAHLYHSPLLPVHCRPI